MATEIKICGLTSAETLDAALAAGADYVGLVFFKGSPRALDFAEAAGLARRAKGKARVVALTVNAESLELTEIVNTIQPDVLQLHGGESPEALDAIRARAAFEIWKAVPVATAEDLDAARAYLPVVDKIVFDAKAPAGATRPGGNATRFDWGLLAGLDLGKPVVLSGGLDPDNVAEAIRLTRPAAVDVSSGVERAPGEKDPGKIRAFIDAVRAADSGAGAAVR